MRYRSRLAKKRSTETPTSSQGIAKEASSQEGTLDWPGPSDCRSYASLLRSAGNAKALLDGKRIHNRLRNHLKRNLFLANLVVQMYGNCGAPEEARTVFDAMHSRDLFSWNFMLKTYVKSGHDQDALQLFEQMHQEGAIPNKFLYVTILSAFSSNAAIANGKLIHARVANGEYNSDMILQTALVSMYAKCGSLRDARWMFNKMRERDAASWNPIVAGYAQQGLRKEALELFGQMRREGLSSNTATIVTVLSTCSNRAALADGRWMHSQIKGTELESDITVGNALIAMYGKCRSLEDADRVFDEMPNRNTITFLNILTASACQASLAKGKRLHDCISKSGLELEVVIGNALINMYGKCGGLDEAWRMFHKMVERNLISWNALLSGYAQNGEGKRALQLFKQMHQEGVMPNKITFVSSVDACASLEDETQGKWLHASIRNSEFELDVILGTALVHMYGKCNSIKDAQDVFDKIPERDVPCWNAIITMYSQHDESKCALLLFDQMQQEGVLPDKITFVSSFTACTSEIVLQEGKQLHARIVFCGLTSDVVVGNAIINMYGKCSSLEDALTFFDSMAKRDNVTFINMFSVCASKAALPEGRQLHAGIMGSEIEADVVVGNALINMYGKCGSLEYARSFFNQMPGRNVVSWNVMLSVYAQNGLGQIALDLFSQMIYECVMPNAVTLVCILSACSHTGLVDEGRDYFYSMTRDYGIAPNADHYNCMIDLLARAGMLDEAEELIKRMPFKPSVVTWTTLLGACRNQVDAERGARAAGRVFKLNPEKSSAYVTLSNIFTAAGREDDAAITISVMKGLKTRPSYYQVEEGSMANSSFHGELQLQKHKFYAELQSLNTQMEEYAIE